MSKNSTNFKLACLVTLSALPFAFLASQAEARQVKHNFVEAICIDPFSSLYCDPLPSGSGSGYGSSSGSGSGEGSCDGSGSGDGSGYGSGGYCDGYGRLMY